MSKEPLIFRRINIQSAPGLKGGLPAIDEFGPGINIIHGPNASGKTTLVRSLCAALWPETASETLRLGVRFDLGTDMWNAQVEGPDCSYRANGEETSAPPLPGADQKDRYQLSLHDLLQHDTRNESFARAILRESAGGYDVRAAARTLDFKDRPSSSRISECGDAEKTKEQLRESQQELEDLKEKRNQLPHLKRKLEDARDAERRHELYLQAINYVRARQTARQHEERLKAFPDVMDRMNGEEYSALETVEEEIATCNHKRREAEKNAEEARDKLEQVQLPTGGPPDGLLTELRELRDSLRSTEDKIQSYDEEIAACKRRRDETLGKVRDCLEVEKLSEITARNWGELAGFAEKAQKLHADRQSWESLKTILQPEEQPRRDVDELRTERQALETWLTHNVGPAEQGFMMRYLPLSGILAVALGGGALALVLPTGALLVSLLVLAFLAGGIVYYVRGKVERENDDLRQTQEKIVRQNDLPGPSTWSAAAVRERLDEIYSALADHAVIEKRQHAWDARADQLDDIEERASDIAQERKQLLEEIGAVPDIPDVQLVTLSHHIARWQDANAELNEYKEKRQALVDKRDQICADIGRKMAPYGYDAPGNAAGVSGHIRSLERRFDRFQEARQELKSASTILEDVDDQLERLTQRREDVFQKLGLDVGENDKLRKLCERYEDYRECQTARDSAQGVLDQAAEQLRQHPAYSGEVEEKDLVELEQEADRLQGQAEKKEETQKRITKIETEIENARHRHEVEEITARHERALDRLQSRLEEDCERMVGNVLVEHVREKSTDANRPEVFHRARGILTMITGRYSLEMQQKERAGFQVHDRVIDRYFALDELSSATRIQVLLAVRMAFVEMQEANVRLPLFMDETLANTDDVRAQAIIESAIELAREGRQVFYLTAQGDEVVRWQKTLQQHDDIGYTIKDLAELREMDRQVIVPSLESFQTDLPAPPSPEGRDHGEYGDAIDVPPLDPRRGAGAAHVWYVVDDVDLLYRLLRMDISHWGSLSNVLQSGNERAISEDSEDIERIRDSGVALEVFVRAWNRGRSEPVDRTTLQESGAVSDTFIDDVAELAREVDGDPVRLIEGLRDGEVARFRTDKIEELEAYLEESGHIDPSPRRSPGEIRLRMMTKLVDRGRSREEATARAAELMNRFASSSASGETD